MEEATKNYELRALCSKDVFPMSKIIGKIGVNEFKTCFESEAVKEAIANGGKDIDMNAIGFTVFLDIANIIIMHLPSCEEDIYNLLSSLSGLSKQDIEELPIATFAEMIVDVIKKDEFKDFFKVALKLFK